VNEISALRLNTLILNLELQINTGILKKKNPALLPKQGFPE